jgi:alkaline phosphatase
MPDRPLRIVLLVAVAILAAVVVLAATVAFLEPFEVFLGPLTVRSQAGATVALPADAAPSLTPATPPDLPAPVARNLVLMVGDGFGIGQVSTASVVLHGADGGMAVERAPVVGLMKTACADRPVTDSAAAATAMATGFKVDYRTISVLPDGRRPTTLFEAAAARGLAVGAVTTTGLTDATPAGFATHAASRYDYADILRQMLASRFDVLIGGDYTLKTKPMGQKDYRDALLRAEELAADGVTVVRHTEDLREATTPFVALLGPRPGSRTAYGPPLAETTSLALDRLATVGREGFVLLVESELTDDSGHDNDVDALVEAVMELDAAVSTVLDFAARRGDTIVLVTADHDTGGVGLTSYDVYGGPVRVGWSSLEHTSQWVPLFAFGPGAELFGGVLDNTDLAVRMAAALGLDGFPAAR